MSKAEFGSKDFQIAIVDDEKVVLDLMADILIDAGYSPEPFQSPLKALEKIKRKKFDALVLDLYMPELPGMLLHAKLKIIDPELARRTVFVTGNFSRDELRKELLESSMLVLKPFTPDVLSGVVARALPPVPRAILAAAAPSLAAAESEQPL